MCERIKGIREGWQTWLPTHRCNRYSSVSKTLIVETTRFSVRSLWRRHPLKFQYLNSRIVTEDPSHVYCLVFLITFPCHNTVNPDGLGSFSTGLYLKGKRLYKIDLKNKILTETFLISSFRPTSVGLGNLLKRVYISTSELLTNALTNLGEAKPLL